MEIRVCNLKRYFGKTKAVDDISFTFSSGHIFAFVGPNGAGKTTTLRVLATLDEPTKGDAFVDGVSVVQDTEKARKLLGFVPDTLPTHRDMSVHEYLDFFARAYGIRAEKRRRAVEDIEEFTNLTGIREKLVNALSRGMKQRLSVARSLIHDPPVLIMDEPAAGLDPRARVELRELLKILAEQGKAILISSHILTELAEICDGAIIIERGRILRAGTMEEILTRAAAQVIVIIRPEERLQEVHKAVLEMPNVKGARVVGYEIEVEVTSAQSACSEILTRLVQGGFRIAEFRHRRADLEDVFMTITKGEVQ
jgi:ABC-2 type transport system ATP-binding protein